MARTAEAKARRQTLSASSSGRERCCIVSPSKPARKNLAIASAVGRAGDRRVRRRRHDRRAFYDRRL
jgi:hypothetical protein